MPVLDSLDLFVQQLMSTGHPIRLVHLAGSLARNEADGKSDVDVVVVPDDEAPLIELTPIAEAAAKAAFAAQERLKSAGLVDFRFSVPKVTRCNDWYTNHWLYGCEFGRMTLSAPYLFGRPVDLALPTGRVAHHDYFACLSSRLLKFLFRLSLEQFYGKPGTTSLRFKVPGKVLRLLVWRDTGLFLKRYDSVFLAAGRLYGGPCSELSRQISQGVHFAFVLPTETALELGEQLIALFHKTCQADHTIGREVLSDQFLSDKRCPLVTETERHIPGAIMTVDARIPSMDSVCAVVSDEPGAWAKAMKAQPKPPQGTPPMLVAPLELFRAFVWYCHPMVALQVGSDPAAKSLQKQLGLATDAPALQADAYRKVAYFRYNALNKWLDYGMQPPFANRAIQALEALRSAVEAVAHFTMADCGSPGELLRPIDDTLALWKNGDGLEDLRTRWLYVADSMPAFNTQNPQSPLVSFDLGKQGFMANQEGA